MPINKYKIVVIIILLLCSGLILYILENNKPVNRFLILSFLNNYKTEFNVIKVKISGCVEHPGNYSIKHDRKLWSLIKKAGGLLPYAGRVSFNSILKDGKEYYIPYRKLRSGERVNINKAPVEILCMLPMINKNEALEILQYRLKYEKFEKIEELKEVFGIGEKKIELLKKFVIIGE